MTTSIRQRLTFCRFLLMLGATAGGAGCQAWGTDRGAERAVPVVEPRQELRVTRTDNRQFVLRDVVVLQDTLFGTNKADKTGIAIPLSDIIRVERRKVSRPPLVAIVGVAAFTLGLLYLLSDFTLDTGFPPAT
jgi:hypothetical protein